MSDYQWSCHPKKLFSLIFATLVSGIVNQASAQIMDSPTEIAQHQLTQQIEKAKIQPYQISSRIHLNKETRAGYLVVEVQLATGRHIYSLTQTGTPPPTILKVLPNDQIQLTGKFNPDKPAVVIENHPDFQQRVEKHTGKVQFFAPIIANPATDVAKLNVDIQFDGQVCSKNACVPVRSKTITGKFAGYFASTPNSTSVAKQPSPQQAIGSGTKLK